MQYRRSHHPTAAHAVFAIVLLGAPLASAATYQVGPTRAYANLQDVADSLQPGDIVELDGDATYPGGVTFDRSGTASAPITIRGIAVQGKRPIL